MSAEIPAGAMRFNSDSQKLEYWNGSAWFQVHTATPNLASAGDRQPGARGLTGGGDEISIEYINISSTGTAVAFGDYCAGPNHTLPTNGAGKNSGGLSVHQFLKVLSTQKISDSGRKKLAKTSAILAQAEGLVFHQESATLRE